MSMPDLQSICTQLQQTVPQAEVRFSLSSPQLLVVDHAFNDIWCEALCREIDHHAHPIGTIDDQGQERPSERRTCEGGQLRPEYALHEGIEQWFENVFLWTRFKTDPTHVIRYQPGQRFDAHLDRFSECQARARGYQRLGSALVYLNDTQGEGALYFNTLGLTITPKKGTLVFMSYPPEIDQEQLLHTAQATTAHNKYVLAKWFTDEFRWEAH